MYCYTGNIRNYPNSNKMFKEKFGSHSSKTFDRFTTKTAAIRTTHAIRVAQQSGDSIVYSERKRNEETRGVSLTKFTANR